MSRHIRNTIRDSYDRAFQRSVWNEPNVIHLYFEVWLNGELQGRYGRDLEERAFDRALELRAQVFACNYEGWQCRPGSSFDTPPLIKELLRDFSE